jgi:GNAT superfamily N-acetyltransferase
LYRISESKWTPSGVWRFMNYLFNCTSLSEEAPIFTARLLGREDCDIFRAMRLHALETCPEFMPLIEDQSDRLPLEIEQSWSTDDWRSFLKDNDKRKFFGLFADEELIGIGQLKRIDTDVAELKSAFIMPEYRGLGLWRLLMDVRVRHAMRMNYKEVWVRHRIENISIKRCLAGTGFVEIYREHTKNKYQDGVYGYRVVLSMPLPVREDTRR